MSMSETITAEIPYTLPTDEKLVNESFGPKNIRGRRTGTIERRKMEVRNGRLLANRLSLEDQGLVFVEHETKVTDFFDENQVKTIYYPEIEELIRRESGASRVVIFDHALRSGDEVEREEKLIRTPVLQAHNDYTEWSGPNRLREILPDEADELLKRRFAHRVGQTYRLKYNPNHRWIYFPQMNRNEAIVFKVYDSLKDGRARFTAHTSFDDPDTPSGALPRQSIEMRAFAF